MKSNVLLMGVASAVIASFATAGALRQTREEPKNIVASHMAGKWIRDDVITARLGGSTKNVALATVEFREEASALKDAPPEALKYVKEHGQFMTGVMTRKGEAHPFTLTQVSGSPYVLYLRPLDGKPSGDVESFFISVAVGETREADLLFTGGDFDNEAFTAYVRAKQ